MSLTAYSGQSVFGVPRVMCLAYLTVEKAPLPRSCPQTRWWNLRVGSRVGVSAIEFISLSCCLASVLCLVINACTSVSPSDCPPSSRSTAAASASSATAGSVSITSTSSPSESSVSSEMPSRSPPSVITGTPASSTSSMITSSSGIATEPASGPASSSGGGDLLAHGATPVIVAGGWSVPPAHFVDDLRFDWTTGDAVAAGALAISLLRRLAGSGIGGIGGVGDSRVKLLRFSGYCVTPNFRSQSLCRRGIEVAA